jgi:HEAT repeat protein
VRYEAVEALRKVGDVKVLGRLISCLGDESVDVRYGAIQALRSLGDERAVKPLVRICLENEDLRSYALEAIKELCGDESTKPVLEALDEIQALVSQVSHRVLTLRRKFSRRASS